MIRYALKCAQDHNFESWFRSAEAFEALASAGQLECPACGNTSVVKALMAPRVSATEHTEVTPAPQTTETTPQEPAEIAKLRAAVEANSDYVGRSFAAEARAIHEGEKPRRSIHGEADASEARALLADGIPVLPLPFRDRRGTN